MFRFRGVCLGSELWLIFFLGAWCFVVARSCGDDGWRSFERWNKADRNGSDAPGLFRQKVCERKCTDDPKLSDLEGLRSNP